MRIVINNNTGLSNLQAMAHVANLERCYIHETKAARFDDKKKGITTIRRHRDIGADDPPQGMQVTYTLGPLQA